MDSGRLSFWFEPAASRRNLRLLRTLFWLITLSGDSCKFGPRVFGLARTETTTSMSPAPTCAAIGLTPSTLTGALFFPGFSLFASGFFARVPMGIHSVASSQFRGAASGASFFEFFFQAFLRAQKTLGWTGDAEEPLSDLGWWLSVTAFFFPLLSMSCLYRPRRRTCS